ncbi:MAG: hypothetical protein IPM71_06310 [Bacteroidota bacterium]|nr:MAG: hypothetical protein IPM71_06310 [Bacteroidota bacterium]
MAKIVVHIGFPRTASTWLQQVYFPQVSNYTFLTRKILNPSLFHESPLTFKHNEFLSKLPRNQNIIISEEMITGNIRGGQVNHWFYSESIDRLVSLFPKAEYVVFLRKQSHFIFSLYSQYIKKGGTYSLRRFLNPANRLEELFLFSPLFANFEPYLEYLSNKVGKERMHVYLYESFRQNPNEFLSKMNTDFGFTIEGSLPSERPLNRGLSPDQLVLYRGLNHFTRYGIPFKHYYFHLPGVYTSREGKGSRQEIPPKAKRYLNDFCRQYAKSNQRIMKDYSLLDMQVFGYPLSSTEQP